MFYRLKYYSPWFFRKSIYHLLLLKMHETVKRVIWRFNVNEIAFLQSLYLLTDFQQLRTNTLQLKGEQNGITIAYLRNSSAILWLVAEVRENDVNLHLQAERDTLKQFFVFGHKNNSWYLSYQYVLLNHHQQQNRCVF